jgi:hypothetical protein
MIGCKEGIAVQFKMIHENDNVRDLDASLAFTKRP